MRDLGPGHVRDAEPSWLEPRKLEALYIAGRNIGDEYRYILDRKYAKKYPGSMLERPSLLLNPWATTPTATAFDEGAGGGGFFVAHPGGERRRGIRRIHELERLQRYLVEGAGVPSTVWSWVSSCPTVSISFW